MIGSSVDFFFFECRYHKVHIRFPGNMPGNFSDLEEEYCSNPDVGKCSVFHEGQEFIVDKEIYLTMLNGQFCSEAWAAINH